MAGIDSEELSRNELQALEVRVDAARSSIPIPSWTLPHARYALLAVSDDMLRLRTVQVIAGELEPEQLTLWLDKSKYMLKYALEHVRDLADAVVRVRPAIPEEDWETAKELLLAHLDWDSAVAAFTSAYASGTRCVRIGTNRYAFRNTLSFSCQANDFLESNTVSIASPDVLVYRYLAAPHEALPRALRECCARMRRNDDRRPRITDALLDEMSARIGERRRVLPETWTSQFGSGRELAQTFRNLWAVCIVHLVAVTNVGGRRHGMNIDALLGEYEAGWLARVMSRNGGVSLEAARRLVEMFTYGYFVSSPDPALQFLFPLRPGLLTVPWFIFLTCNAERNFLTLLARVLPEEFHRASAAFETGMTEELREVLAERSWRAIYNRTLPNETAAGEIDAILIDASSRVILVVELRWFVEPSESREVSERQRAGTEKADKARKKRDAVARQTSRILDTVADGNSDEWTIDAVAVFDNYLPTAPATSDVPFISHRAFLSGVLRFERLTDLIAWTREGAWLPVAGKHFHETPTPADFDGLQIQVDGLNVSDTGLQFVLERDRALLTRWNLLPPSEDS